MANDAITSLYAAWKPLDSPGHGLRWAPRSQVYMQRFPTSQLRTSLASPQPEVDLRYWWLLGFKRSQHALTNLRTPRVEPKLFENPVTRDESRQLVYPVIALYQPMIPQGLDYLTSSDLVLVLLSLQSEPTSPQIPSRAPYFPARPGFSEGGHAPSAPE